MAKISQVRGMLLEEILLHLLRAAGYRTIEEADTDDTLNDGAAGLEVLGRGCKHQIDAVADFMVPHPFSHRQRLLVEAKCFSDGNPVGVEIVRNAVGVLKDVSEFWVTSGSEAIPKSRYHYQYALFSATGDTVPAQRYAYAQDVYLIPLSKSRFIASAIQAIRTISTSDFGLPVQSNIPVRLREMRLLVRAALRSPLAVPYHDDYGPMLRTKLNNLISETLQIRYALLGVLGKGFPVFLTPSRDLALNSLPSVINVRVRWDQRGWYLDSLEDERLFSFDLPPELFELYAEEGVLSPRQAINLKQETMRTFYAFRTTGNDVSVLRFELDGQWLETIREGVRTVSPSLE
jgi:hypothetical protein